MHHDVGVAADGGGEVSVERHVQGVVVEEGLVIQDASAEVESHLEGEETREGCEQGWCHEAGGVWLCKTQRQQPMALLKISWWFFTCCSVWAAEALQKLSTE